MPHKPVMIAEVLESLSPKEGGIYVDGTFGAGGYTRAILDSAPCTVIAIDRDSSVQTFADDLKDKYGERFIFIRGAFGDVETLLRENGFDKVDGFVLDIGVSSMQLDQGERGFSFRTDADLDMRMDQTQGVTAADIVNSYEESDLANLIYKYGEERASRRIAKKISETRVETPIKTTGELTRLIHSVLPKTSRNDPATRTFQALRIAVNDELGQLEQALEASKLILKTEGRLVVVTFHSLEDRIVKNFIAENAGLLSRGSRHMPENEIPESFFKVLRKKAIKPLPEEINENPRARSAKLRMGVRL